jgi:hypothetical protein
MHPLSFPAVAASLLAGTARDSRGASRAVLWDDATIYGLNALVLPGSPITMEFAWGMNDLGWSVGQGSDVDGNNIGFLAIPVHVAAPAQVAGMLRARPAPYR